MIHRHGKESPSRQPPASALCTWLGFALTYLPCSALASLTGPEFSSEDIGGASPAGVVIESADGGVNIVAAGEGVGGRSDQFHFHYRERTGDFDRRIRVESIENTHPWARAGLMVRETVESGSVYVAILGTPSISGCSFGYRAGTGQDAVATGSFRANYPHTWLRLKRAGNRFTGFASFDGESWVPLGEESIDAPETMLFGTAVASHSAEVTTARFRDAAEVDGARLPSMPAIEPLGPSSRRTGLVISEIMYRPAHRTGGQRLEFVELFNTEPIDLDLSGFSLDGSIHYTFPPGQTIRAGGFLVLAKSPLDLAGTYGLESMPATYADELPDGSGVVRLLNRGGAVLLEVDYSSEWPWPVAANGAGHSLVLHRPSHGQANPKAWSASYAVGGSPGKLDPIRVSPLREVRINEIQVAGAAMGGFVELYNHSALEVDLSGCALTDDPLTSKLSFDDPTVLDAGGHLALSFEELGFPLPPAGGAVYLLSPNRDWVVDALEYSAQTPGVAVGPAPDGSPGFRRLSSPTPGAANGRPRTPKVVINEIMYHPISGESDDEYVELHNPGSDAVGLGGWRFVDGIDYTFPENAQLPPGGYLVVARNVARFMTNYSGLNLANTFGDYGGSLANGGERVALAAPATSDSPASPGEEPKYIVVDEVVYGDGARWGRWSDGGGSSLELKDPRSDNLLAANWADSETSAEAPWTMIEQTGPLDHGATSAGSLQAFLLGAGECLVDDVELFRPGEANIVPNPDFGESAESWTALGNHEESGHEDRSGQGGGGSYRLRAQGRGDTGANCVWTRLANPRPRRGEIMTLRARAKWLRGHPEVLLRLHGNYLEATGALAVPSDLGTPGAVNSQASANAAPVIHDVAHTPVLPAADEAVVVSCRAEDPDGLAGITLHYRVDPDVELSAFPMSDDGSEGDRVAGDGVFSARVPGQPAGTTIAFHIVATDGDQPGLTGSFPAEAPGRECLVRFGEVTPASSFGTYRLWLTRDTVREWSRRLKLHNGDLDATFVYGDSRVIYNIGALYSGSPWVSPGYSGPTGALCGYVLHLPDDDPVLGATDFVLDYSPRDATQQFEQIAFWMAQEMGIPFNRRRSIHLFVDGRERGRIYEDVQQPNSDLIEEFFPGDTEGDLYKIEDWFEFPTSPTGHEFNADASLEDFATVGGVKKQARYRWNWRKRAVRGSANDYSSLFALVDAVNAPPSVYSSQVAALVNVDEWMRTFVVEHMVGNWDSYGYQRGKNMYAYKPTNGRWHLIPWDIDFVFSAGGHAATTSMFFTIEPMIQRMFSDGLMVRSYLRAMEEAVSGPLAAHRVEPLMDAKHAALRDNGVSASSPRAGKRYIEKRREFLSQVLADFEAEFSITANQGTDFSTDRNLATLTGTAPLKVRTILANGLPYPVVWDSVTSWRMRVPLSSPVTSIAVVGIDTQGHPVADASDEITISYTGPEASSRESLVINEIMYHSAQPGAEFIELHNTSSHSAFDLSDYRIRGADFSFAPGAVIQAGGYLVVARDRGAFLAAYGNAIPIAGEFNGRLQNQGETLELIRSGGGAGLEEVVDRASYGSQPPWPALANGGGPSLQLIDARRENDRIGNWAVVSPPPSDTEWKHATVTGIATSSRLLMYLSSIPPLTDLRDVAGRWQGAILAPNDPLAMQVQIRSLAQGGYQGDLLVSGSSPIPFSNVVSEDSRLVLDILEIQGSPRWEGTLSEEGAEISGTFTQGDQSFPFTLSRFIPGGDVYIDDVWLTRGETAEADDNLVENGDFGADLDGSWTVSPNHSSSRIDRDVGHAAAGSLHLRAADGGTGLGTAVWREIRGLTAAEQYTLSYWYRLGDSGVGLTVQLEDWSLTTTESIDPNAGLLGRYTPGARNAVAADLPPFSSLWINEILPENRSILTDRFGDFDPWVELHNSGAETIALDPFFLSPDYSDLTRWRFPPGAAIGPGEYLVVWLDSEPEESDDAEWHASFRPEADSGAIYLARAGERRTILHDFMRHGAVAADRSFGRVPGGPSDTFQVFDHPTPGNANTAASALPQLFINEWMAGNDGAVIDPADPPGGDFDDWFELYHADDRPLDLTGYTLTDDLTRPAKWSIPAGTRMAGKGFLLVWADEEGSQNGVNGSLHANFKLSRGGEEIAVFAPNGSLLDHVVFRDQTPNLSGGRWPDGGAPPFLRLGAPTPGKPNVLEPTLSPPEILDLSFEDGRAITLTWTVQANRGYRVQRNDAIEDAEWVELGPIVRVPGPTASYSDPLPSNASHRFYRIVLVD